jgi:hypothetical protein
VTISTATAPTPHPAAPEAIQAVIERSTALAWSPRRVSSIAAAMPSSFALVVQPSSFSTGTSAA